MSQTPIIIDFELKELLGNLDKKMDKLDEKMDKIGEKVNKLEIGQAAMAEKIDAIDKRLTKLENTQDKQGWSLIGIIGGAVVSGIVIAIWRTAIMGKV